MTAIPKPERVEVGQWWSRTRFSGGPARVIRLEDGHAILAQLRSHDCTIKVSFRLMLDEPKWRYLGNGERPDVGGSEVAGDEER
jgi:hypothetical protein